MFKFENIIESLVEKKIQKSKSVNNDKDLQKEELTIQIICFIEKIIENTIQMYIRPIEEQLRSQETQILQLQSQLISFHHLFSPKNKEIIKIEKQESPIKSNEIQIQIVELETKVQSITKQQEIYNDQLIEFKQENKSKTIFKYYKESFYSYWVLLNDLNENVNKIKDFLITFDQEELNQSHKSSNNKLSRNNTKKDY
ncbi:unnamed protein product [Paramecium sonneborni]|uniref:Uncharacterized protein n=1 Tax=Paramecium sonneborni TaxID=65129 RepID=A0A8S1R2V2_9CILI|nr:unnamed protein product [Paramecium sonneborni]